MPAGQECNYRCAGEGVAGGALLSRVERSIGIVLVVLATGGAVAALRGDFEWLLTPDPAPHAAVTANENKPRGAAPDVAADAAAPAVMSKRASTTPVGDRAPRVAGTAPWPATFDVIRIDPDGTSVFAGRGPARTQLNILANGVTVTTVGTDGEGQWATALAYHFDPGDYEFALSYRTGESNAAIVGQRVAMHLIAGETPPVASERATAARPQARPSPITFIYNEANFTDEGRARAAALAAYFRERRIAAATLSGHADERGSDLYNLRLSQERLDAVVRFLRAGGFAGRLVLVPVGKREPYAGADRPRMSAEEAFAHDRRVELRGTQ
jgi:outer membrane protein OmpA-like peptidoglycan-associated protein